MIGIAVEVKKRQLAKTFFLMSLGGGGGASLKKRGG